MTITVNELNDRIGDRIIRESIGADESGAEAQQRMIREQGVDPDDIYGLAAESFSAMIRVMLEITERYDNRQDLNEKLLEMERQPFIHGFLLGCSATVAKEAGLLS